jgi:hypothetical protein
MKLRRRFSEAFVMAIWHYVRFARPTILVFPAGFLLFIRQGKARTLAETRHSPC